MNQPNNNLYHYIWVWGGKRGNQTTKEWMTERTSERKQKHHCLELQAWEYQSSWLSQYAYWRPHKRTKWKASHVLCSLHLFCSSFFRSFLFPFALLALKAFYLLLLSWGLQMCVLGEVEKIACSNSQHLHLSSAQHGPAWSSVCSVAEFLLSYRAFIPSLLWHQARVRFSLLKYLNLCVQQEERGKGVRWLHHVLWFHLLCIIKLI